MTDNFENMVEVQCPTCPWCGKSAVLLVPHAGLLAYRSGAFVQDAFPTLVPNMREMLMTGTHPACWESMFGVPDDEPDYEPDTYVSPSDDDYFSDKAEERYTRWMQGD